MTALIRATMSLKKYQEIKLDHESIQIHHNTKKKILDGKSIRYMEQNLLSYGDYVMAVAVNQKQFKYIPEYLKNQDFLAFIQN